MCEGFGGIATRSLDLFWSEPDDGGDCSHCATIERMGIEDNNDIFLRNFVRWQCPDWTIGSFQFDENSTLPGWAEEHRQEIINKVSGLLEKVLPLWAEYERIRQPAWAEYQRIRDAALAEYERIEKSALAEYQRIEKPALAEYERIEQPAWDEMTQSMRKLSGFAAAEVIDDQN